MKRCVIIGGAEIGNYERVRGYLAADDFFIFCDSGLRHLEKLGVEPGLIVGDFDSHEDPRMDVETITLPRAKDDTDTVYGLRCGLGRGFKDFLFLGVIGGRFDHSLGNVSMLLKLDSLGLDGLIVDDFSEMEVVSPRRGVVKIPDSYPYFSLLAAGGPARGVTEHGVKFPLEDAEIGPDYQYGVSNEVLPGQTAEVSVREGRLLLIKDL